MATKKVKTMAEKIEAQIKKTTEKQKKLELEVASLQRQAAMLKQFKTTDVRNFIVIKIDKYNHKTAHMWPHDGVTVHIHLLKFKPNSIKFGAETDITGIREQDLYVVYRVLAKQIQKIELEWRAHDDDTNGYIDGRSGWYMNDIKDYHFCSIGVLTDAEYNTLTNQLMNVNLRSANLDICHMTTNMLQTYGTYDINYRRYINNESITSDNIAIVINDLKTELGIKE